MQQNLIIETFASAEELEKTTQIIKKKFHVLKSKTVIIVVDEVEQFHTMEHAEGDNIVMTIDDNLALILPFKHMKNIYYD